MLCRKIGQAWQRLLYGCQHFAEKENISQVFLVFFIFLLSLIYIFYLNGKTFDFLLIFNTPSSFVGGWTAVSHAYAINLIALNGDNKSIYLKS